MFKILIKINAVRKNMHGILKVGIGFKAKK